MIRPVTHQPRSKFLYVVSLALLVCGGYLLYELGRFQAGYFLLDQRRERLEAEAAVAERDATIDELRRRLTVLETSREIDQETYAEVEKTLSQLQARIQEQEEELAFYQGIVSPDDGLAGLRIQNLEVSAADAEQHYTLRVVLVQAIIHDQTVAGTVSLSIAGTRHGEPVDLELRDLAVDGETESLAYAFRYFQDLEQELRLPVGFEPDRVDVEIRPRQPRGEQVSQSFEWSAVLT